MEITYHLTACQDIRCFCVSEGDLILQISKWGDKNDRRNICEVFIRQSAGGIHRGTNSGVYSVCRKERDNNSSALHRPSVFCKD